MKRKYSWNLRQAIEQHGFTPIELKSNAQYETGKTYWCNYWSKSYTVLDVEYQKHGKYDHLKSVTVKWDDGKVATHCTELDVLRDWELITV